MADRDGSTPEEPLPPPIGTLVIRSVVDISVEDEAEIGWYSVSGLEYETDTTRLRITCNAPCEIVVRCRELDAEFIRG